MVWLPPFPMAHLDVKSQCLTHARGVLQALGQMFRVPPFPLARLEAAVLPGPHNFEDTAPVAAPPRAAPQEAPPAEAQEEKPSADGPPADGAAKPAEQLSPKRAGKGKKPVARKARSRRSRGAASQVWACPA